MSDLPDQPLPATITGVVLAGGLSRRMGQDKAAMLFGGETLLARAVRLLSAAVDQVIVVGPPERAALVPRTPIVPDVYPNRGPLAGLYTCLQATTTAYVFVVACDMPCLQPALIRYLATLAPGHDIVVPRSQRGTEQLHALYGRACLPVAASGLRAGTLAVSSLFGRVRTRVVEPNEWSRYDPDGWSFINANTPEDWQRIMTHLRDETEQAGG